VITANGFKKNNLTDLTLNAESPRTVNVTLETGGATESVEVHGDEVVGGGWIV
jgi:hypothetical protein